ncbi:MAG: MerR family DNA-binding transcriptional regulator [Sarcina sp.]
MSKYYSIGEVSKIFGISIDTLRYYDKIGLIKPIVNPENKYRYYEISHLYLLLVILEARYSEISIKNISDFIKSEDMDVYYDFFDKQEKDIDIKINNLKRIKESVKRSKEKITEIKAFENNYDTKDLIKIDAKKLFYKINIKELITKTRCKRFSNVLYIESITAEYYLMYQLSADENAIEIQSGYMYIEECSENKKFLDILKHNKNIVLEEYRQEGSFIISKFLGSSKETARYISLIKKSRNSSFENILIKNISYIPKETGIIYFSEILLKI